MLTVNLPGSGTESGSLTPGFFIYLSEVTSNWTHVVAFADRHSDYDDLP